NPASSSPGLAFLLTTISIYGEDSYLDFWQALKQNNLLITDGWSEAYWDEFSASGQGQRPLVVSYATSPAAEVYFSEGLYDTPPTGAILAEQTCFRQIEYVGVLRGTEQQDLAQKFIDFMLSREYQADIPLKMWVFPARLDVALPEVFQNHAQIALDPITGQDLDIENQRETWVKAWREIMR
ncbi:MAG TPA: thiamine ABC transporter substrate-binding protein, partial [Candidatus Wirthbacteria bacterium]|nr:thiamine ABC transporter substrate-binding protein [Candidatus Wirthbacteria bacterium]